MKKFLMMALVAVMAFSAQAVNVDWTGKKDHFGLLTDASFQNMSTDGKVSIQPVNDRFARPATMVASFLLNARTKDFGNGKGVGIFDVGLWGGGGMKFSAGADNTLDITFRGSAVESLNGGSVNKRIDLGDSNNVNLAFMVEPGTAKNRLTWYLNGVEQGSAEFLATGSGGLKGMEFESVNTDTIKVGVYDGVIADHQAEWLGKNNTTVLPEPTVLALLALGVAGLALKRKVA